MTVLSDNEKLVKEADRRYKSIREKLLYVNGKLGLLGPDGRIKRDSKGRPIEGSIPQAKFYRMLGVIDTKLAQRTEEASRALLPDLLDTKDEYEKQRGDTLVDIDKARSNDNFVGVAILRKTLIELSVIISNIKEEIAFLHDEGELKKFERPSTLSIIA